MNNRTDLPRVLIVGNYGPDRAQSQAGFAKWLTNRMPQEGFDVSYISAPKRFGGGNDRTAKWRGYIDKFVLFPSQLRKVAKTVDMAHVSDQCHSMYGKYLGKRWGITVHDLLPQRAVLGEFPGWEIGATGRIYQDWIKKSLMKARWVACASSATLDEFRKTINPNPEVSYLTWNGLYNEFNRLPSDVAAKLLSDAGHGYLNDQPFVFHLGGNQSYKNRPGFVRIVNELHKGGPCKDLLYVMAGKPFDDKLKAAVADATLGKSLIHIESPAFDVVKALYSTAQGLIFPSTAEGFGLPVIEGMSMGCPVFTSNRAPMIDIGGSAARYFDPMDPKGAADAISSAWNERERMIEQGFDQVKLFSSDASAASYRDWYKRILAS